MKKLAFPWRELIGAVCLVATLILSHMYPMGFAPSYLDEAPKKRATEAQTLQLNQPAASAVPVRLL